MITNKLKIFAVALSLVLFSGVAMATTIDNEDGSFEFGGFDWASNGTAVITDFEPVTGDVFNLIFYAFAANITRPNGVPYAGTGVGSTYEYSIVATMSETVTCLDGGCANATFVVNDGNFKIYYDTGVNADMASGEGFTDGTEIISGTIFPQYGGVFINGIGVAQLQSVITYTNGTFITPDLITSQAISTLQFGNAETNWTAPDGTMPDPLGGTQDLPAEFLALQADANQTFAPIPEPGTLVLLGLGLTGLAVISRRRK